MSQTPLIEPDPGLATSESELTLLLTDVEGSTRMWERSPVAMQQALASHDRIVADVVTEHGGKLVKTRGEGDSTFSVFPDPQRAVAAAFALQQRMHDESWPSQASIRLRVAVHTGEAELRSDDYFGPTVNRCARIRAAAHGGQVVLSRAARDLVIESLPPGASLLDLGRHRLKDLALPEQLFQLCHDTLPQEFPPLRTVDAANGNLPLQLTSFIGRRRELAELERILETARLVTLLGTGGAGKSRLAQQLARQHTDQFSDGVWWVELAPVSDPDLVASSIAQTLGLYDEALPLGAGRVSSGAAGSSMRRLIDHLGNSQMLIVLDNCEHLVASCATVCSGILSACSGVKIITTSQEPLGVPGELVWRVPSLALPAKDSTLSLDLLGGYEAISLFVDRARLVNQGFELTAADAPAVIDICRRLDGMPLAIELAAARVAAMTPGQISERLRDQFRLLTGGARTLPTRQQTLKAAIDWSHGLLTEGEQILFRRLSVLSGGFTLDAAESVCADDQVESWEVLDLLSRLVDKSLLVPPSMDADSRYHLLETIRQYAAEKLRESPEEAQIQRRHCEYFLALAERAEPELTRPDQASWMDTLEHEHDNLRSALDWAAQAGEPDLQMRIVRAIWRFWYVRGHVDEGRHRLKRALADDPRPVSASRAFAMAAAGRLADAGHDPAEARQLLEGAVQMAGEVGDQSVAWLAVAYLAQVRGEYGEWEEARELGDRGLAIARELDDPRRIALSLISTGRLAYYRCDYEAARTRINEGLQIARDQGDRRNVYVALHTLGDMANDLGNLDEAALLLEQCAGSAEGVASPAAFAIHLASQARTKVLGEDYPDADDLIESAREMVRPTGGQVPTEVLEVQARLAQRRDDPAGAIELAREILRRLARSGERRRIPRIIGLLATAHAAMGAYTDAASYFGAADALRTAMGSCLSPVEAPRYTRMLQETRDHMDISDFEAATAKGRAMSIEDLAELD